MWQQFGAWILKKKLIPQAVMKDVYCILFIKEFIAYHYKHVFFMTYEYNL